MRRLLLSFTLFVFASQVAMAAWVLQDSSVQPAPAGLAFTERRVKSVTSDATLWVVTFDPKTHAFAVMDNPNGAFDLGSAAAKRGALAGVNGGYFQPDRTPLGLLIRQGVELHPLEHAKLLSGVLSVTPTAITIQRTAAFKASPAVREALQAGPFLVEGGKPIVGLEATKNAARTVVIQDAKGHYGFLICKSTTLAGMAEILATASIFPEGKIVRALNLDGGTSTALWVRGTPAFYAREWKSVRDYVAIVPR
ncbi:MAG: phosphodiester glycosidase family protein [Chthoniobacter sp.]|uniref:phosphodiester glycosidase family protein n=1 Tax=Chthoniobacter sp. TaxID=2510640 RepID=UPI0032A32B83